MRYYRFRPTGELSLKEILYDEMYFASAEECNDPFDGGRFFAFPDDWERWERLIINAWRDIPLAAKTETAATLARAIANLGSLSYGEAWRLDYLALCRSVLDEGSKGAAPVLSLFIRRYLAIYRPRAPYFVSLSRSVESPIMWSHYASRHEGHCLIFKAIDGHIHQCSSRIRKSISRDGLKAGLAPRVSYALPGKFKVQDVTYGNPSAPQDAFMCFPIDVFGRELEEDERMAMHRTSDQQSMQKHPEWSYEQESRLLMHPPMSSMFGEPTEATQQERLLHFQPTQLAGIVIGARASESRKARIHEIVAQRGERIMSSDLKGQALFDFVVFQAELKPEERVVHVRPTKICAGSQVVTPDDSSFEAKLKRWEEGQAILFTETGASKRTFA